MLTKEEYQREYVRMMDSVRNCREGSLSCACVRCENCALNDVCNSNISTTAQPFEIIEAVEKWSKEHPIVTMAGKYKEVFGVEPRGIDGAFVCPGWVGFSIEKCDGVPCEDCKRDFWNSEYKESSVNE